jgi:NAD(P)H-flavin reductase
VDDSGRTAAQTGKGVVRESRATGRQIEAKVHGKCSGDHRHRLSMPARTFHELGFELPPPFCVVVVAGGIGLAPLRGTVRDWSPGSGR